MSSQVRAYRTVVVLLAALVVVLATVLTVTPRADAVDGPVEVVYVASGRNFPDALAGATLAATTGAPLLTVEPNLPLPAHTTAALRSLAPGRIVILGGPGAVSEAVQGALAQFTTSGSVIRIAGNDRHETAALIADALPDRVHDADLLDGLDSTDFLRADATAADSHLLDGFTHQQQRFISVPVQAAYTSGEVLRTEDRIRLLSSGVAAATIGWTMPPDYTQNDPIQVDVMFRNDDTQPCVMHLQVEGIMGPFDELATFTNSAWDRSVGTSPQLPLAPGPQTVTFTARTAQGLVPGAVVNLRLERNATEPQDTCSGFQYLHGFLVRY